MVERCLLLGLCAFGVVLAFMPTYITWLIKVKCGQMIQADGPPHQNKANTPTMGGALFMCVFFLLLYLIGFQEDLFISPFLCLVIGFSGMGVMDDYLKIINKNNDRGLTAKQKLFFQCFFACLSVAVWVWLDGIELVAVLHVPGQMVLSGYYYLGFGYFLWAILVIVASSNAVNLTDGLDGLAVMLVAMVCLALWLVSFGLNAINLSFVPHLSSVRLVLSLLVGVCCGFYCYNKHPARVFMGDSGSLPLGALLGFAALMLMLEFAYALMAGVFIINTVSVIIQVLVYKRTKKRFFKMAPLHHHFELSGFPESTVVYGFYGVALCCCCLALCWVLNGY